MQLIIFCLPVNGDAEWPALQDFFGATKNDVVRKEMIGLIALWLIFVPLPLNGLNWLSNKVWIDLELFPLPLSIDCPGIQLVNIDRPVVVG